MIKLQDHFLLTRRSEPVGVKQDLHSLQASGKSHNVHLWYVPLFELLQNRMHTKDPVPSSMGVLIPGSVKSSSSFNLLLKYHFHGNKSRLSGLKMPSVTSYCAQRGRTVARKSSIVGLYVCAGELCIHAGGLTFKFDKNSTNL